jgi:hypothetical protein
VLGKKKDKDKDESDEEQENLVTVDQRIEDESSLCSEYIKSVITSENWVVDSGATRHFSNFREEFKAIKRWSTRKTVRVADGTTYTVDGYSSVIINTTYGPYKLREVW